LTSSASGFLRRRGCTGACGNIGEDPGDGTPVEEVLPDDGDAPAVAALKPHFWLTARAGSL
jgi:hypothetical protein